jgi:uncharacterized protein (DUF1330 family)
MSTYFIAQITIHDREMYERYLDGFDQVFAAHAGEVVVVDDGPAVLEGSWTCTRTVVIRFGSEDDARRWYDSAEYQELVRYRHRASEANAVLVQGRS